jgi:hypothetical protein
MTKTITKAHQFLSICILESRDRKLPGNIFEFAEKRLGPIVANPQSSRKTAPVMCWQFLLGVS